MYLVGVVPNGDTNTVLDSHALLDDGLVIRLLLSEEGSRGRESHADVEFRDRDFETERRELLHDRRHSRRNLTDDEVALEANSAHISTSRDMH